jgi:hypothetical protein
VSYDRFPFAQRIGDSVEGLILDVGVNDDPGHNRAFFGERYFSADRYDFDDALKYDINADYYFDAGNDPWPFEADHFGLVIMCEITEHLYPREAIRAYEEAHRVSPNLVVTRRRLSPRRARRTSTIATRSTCSACWRRPAGRSSSGTTWTMDGGPRAASSSTRSGRSMTVARFEFARMLGDEIPGKVLEIGVNDDPAGNAAFWGERYESADKFDWDHELGYAIVADHYFDAGADIWPFADRSFRLVIMCEVLEHLTPEEAHHALREAHRVGTDLCLTAPQDGRFLTDPAKGWAAGSPHITYVTEPYLLDLLVSTGWNLAYFEKRYYGDWAEQGFFVHAYA